MIHKPRIAVIVLALTAGMLAVSGCLSDSDTLPQDKYVAVEEHLRVDSRVTNGSNPMVGGITPPFSYNYHGSAASGWGFWAGSEGYYPEINGSFKVLYGTTYMRDVNPGRTVTGLHVKGAYSYPYVGESGFSIENVSQNGTIYGSYKNATIVLRTGEQWSTPVLTETTTTNGTAYDNMPYSYTAIYNTTWTITNLGVYDKSNLTRYKNSKSDTGYYMGF